MIGFASIRTRLDGRWQEVVEPGHATLNGHPLCTFEAGYRSDGLSRPWWMFWKWRRFDARYRDAALLHDYLLDTSDLPKWVIDWLFMGALRASGVSALEAGIFWLAVRTRKPGKAFRAGN